MTLLAVGLALSGLCASTGWAAWEWWIDVESRVRSDERDTVERLFALTCLQVPAWAAMMVAMVDGARQRRDASTDAEAGGGVAAVTVAAGALSFLVSVVIFTQSAVLWFFEPFHRVVIGRPLPGAALPEGPAGWAWDAQMEHQAVAAFLELADDLAHHGAPEALVGACQQAADEEAYHARESASLAGVELAALEPVARPRPGRRQIAWESLVHGVIGEGRAVAVARARLREARTPRERALLSRIAEEERSHARLGARVAAWALFGKPRGRSFATQPSPPTSSSSAT